MGSNDRFVFKHFIFTIVFINSWSPLIIIFETIGEGGGVDWSKSVKFKWWKKLNWWVDERLYVFFCYRENVRLNILLYVNVIKSRYLVLFGRMISITSMVRLDTVLFPSYIFSVFHLQSSAHSSFVWKKKITRIISLWFTIKDTAYTAFVPRRSDEYGNFIPAALLQSLYNKMP